MAKKTKKASFILKMDRRKEVRLSEIILGEISSFPCVKYEGGKL